MQIQFNFYKCDSNFLKLYQKKKNNNNFKHFYICNILIICKIIEDYDNFQNKYNLFFILNCT